MVFWSSMQWLPVLMCLASLLVSIASHGFECKHNNNKIEIYQDSQGIVEKFDTSDACLQ